MGCGLTALRWLHVCTQVNGWWESSVHVGEGLLGQSQTRLWTHAQLRVGEESWTRRC